MEEEADILFISRIQKEGGIDKKYTSKIEHIFSMKKLAIICADENQIPLVNKAKEMGIETHCFSWDRESHNVCKKIADYYHPISILEKEQILDKCREIKIDGVTSILNDYAVPMIAYVAQNMGLPGNRYEDMLIMGNKFTASQNFLKHGLQVPRSAIVPKGQERVDLSGLNYPLIVKPTDRSTAVGVKRVEKEEDLHEAIMQAQEISYRKEAIVEEFIEGLEATVDTISYNGKHHILVIKERENIDGENGPVKIAGHLPFELSADFQDNIIDETRKALDSINFRYGANNTQFRIKKDGRIFLFEINPRMAGDKSHIIMKLHNGYDVVKGVIDVALGQFEKPVFTEKKYSGIYFCRENTENIRQAIENKENDPDIMEAVLFNDEEKYLGRIGYFIYQSDKKRRWNL